MSVCLDNLDVEMLMDGENFEVETRPQGELQGVKQENPTLNNEGRLAASKRQRISGGVGRRRIVPRADCCYDNWIEEMVTST